MLQIAPVVWENVPFSIIKTRKLSENELDHIGNSLNPNGI
jgi:hypothetical protein